VALSGRFPYLQEGDVVDLEIAGLGRQRQTYVPTPAPQTAVRTEAADPRHYAEATAGPSREA
jgi:2,4-diketo-3-deoxy-L-fuconate hydrolase